MFDEHTLKVSNNSTSTDTLVQRFLILALTFLAVFLWAFTEPNTYSLIISVPTTGRFKV
jgi:hypothetical protein